MTRRILYAAAFSIVIFILERAVGLTTKCKCDCPGSELTCGKDLKTNALQTFKNPCQMICQNCIQNEKWIAVKSGECDKGVRPKRRLSPATSPAMAKAHSDDVAPHKQQPSSPKLDTILLKAAASSRSSGPSSTPSSQLTPAPSILTPQSTTHPQLPPKTSAQEQTPKVLARGQQIPLKSQAALSPPQTTKSTAAEPIKASELVSSKATAAGTKDVPARQRASVSKG